MPTLTLYPGQIFANDFRILRPLQSGGMGAVYVAQQLSTARERALKIMLGELVSNADLRRRFEQEARIGAQIESEHVVEVVGAGIDGPSGAPWLAMELLHGEDLAAHLQRTGPLAPSAVLEIFDQLAHALGAAHAKQIVHRDLKPENLFLAQTRRAGARFMVKVLDFGIAKLVDRARTSATNAMGTPLWMAPEQAQSGLAVTPAADVWAMGLIAFRALAGRPYWKSAAALDTSPMMLLREMLMDPIVPASVRALELRCAELPAGFDAWFARCVDRTPAARFRDATVMHAELRRVLDAAQWRAAMPLASMPKVLPPNAARRTVEAAPLTAAGLAHPVVRMTELAQTPPPISAPPRIAAPPLRPAGTPTGLIAFSVGTLAALLALAIVLSTRHTSDSEPTFSTPARTPATTDGRPGAASSGVCAAREGDCRNGECRRVTAIAASFATTCALLANHGVRCWGWESGAFGSWASKEACHDPQKELRCSSKAVRTVIDGKTAAADSFTAGTDGTCASCGAGALFCMKSEFSQRLRPDDHGAPTNGCSPNGDGSLRCVGENRYGQLGNGTTERGSAAVDPGLTSVSELWGNGSSPDGYCAVAAGGDIFCWGNNETGQVGRKRTGACTPYGTVEPCETKPIRVSNVRGAHLAGSDTTHCAWTERGAATCWGPLGKGDYGTDRVELAGAGTRKVVAGYKHACALLEDATVRCADGGAAAHDMGLSDVADVVAGFDHTCALLRSGKVKCWGDNQRGQLGNGTFEKSGTPVDVRIDE